jgi:hypothetical protein
VDIDITDSINEIEPVIFVRILRSVGESRSKTVREDAVKASRVTWLVVTIIVGNVSRTAVTVWT